MRPESLDTSGKGSLLSSLGDTLDCGPVWARCAAERCFGIHSEPRDGTCDPQKSRHEEGGSPAQVLGYPGRERSRNLRRRSALPYS